MHLLWNRGRFLSYIGWIIEAEIFDESVSKSRVSRFWAALFLAEVTHKRESTKSRCFEYVDSEALLGAGAFQSDGDGVAIVSNCSSEEVKAIRPSRIYCCFDQVRLSYETCRTKPDIRIYEKVANLLGVASSECIFVGDGGSKAGFLVAEAPLAILRAHV